MFSIFPEMTNIYVVSDIIWCEVLCDQSRILSKRALACVHTLCIVDVLTIKFAEKCGRKTTCISISKRCPTFGEPQNTCAAKHVAHHWRRHTSQSGNRRRCFVAAHTNWRRRYEGNERVFWRHVHHTIHRRAATLAHRLDFAFAPFYRVLVVPEV